MMLKRRIMADQTEKIYRQSRGTPRPDVLTLNRDSTG